MRRVRILECDFDAVTPSDALAWAAGRLRRRERARLCTVNVAILMQLRALPELARYVAGSELVVADGQPIVWASRLLGSPLPERVAGVDLVVDLCGLAAREGFGVYLLGGTSALLERTAERLRASAPGLRLCGLADGYFPPEQAFARARAVAESGADLLLVGMGVPRQEAFIAGQWERLGATLAIGVGGSFEVIAGLRRRAPRWAQLAGLEWMVRLAQEPRRLWRRYLVSNTQFGLHLLRALMRRSREA
jgi:N-acetylglucosaminyldiphosphoundecaprenol N-acetyl-beta-D-mannosaminyltransferase